RVQYAAGSSPVCVGRSCGGLGCASAGIGGAGFGDVLGSFAVGAWQSPAVGGAAISISASGGICIVCGTWSIGWAGVGGVYAAAARAARKISCCATVDPVVSAGSWWSASGIDGMVCAAIVGRRIQARG